MLIGQQVYGREYFGISTTENTIGTMNQMKSWSEFWLQEIMNDVTLNAKC